MKIAIVNSSTFGMYFPEHIEKLSVLGKVEKINTGTGARGGELAKKLKGFEVVIASVTPWYDPDFFAANKDILLIARHGVGINNVDLNSATESGVIVTKVTGKMERDSVAEHAVTLLLQVARKIIPAVEAVKRGKWSERAKFTGVEIRDKNVGIIGIGEIGSKVAEILKGGFNATILAYDPYLDPNVIRERGAEPADFEDLLERSDIISLNCPFNKENYHMLGEKEFSRMKDGVIIVNTARGELIDEKALINVLEKGKIGGIGMDVLEGEPIDEKHPLLKFDKTVIVPHIAAYTMESLKRMGDKVVKDVESIVKKQVPNYVANPDVLKAKNRAGIL